MARWARATPPRRRSGQRRCGTRRPPTCRASCPLRPQGARGERGQLGTRRTLCSLPGGERAPGPSNGQSTYAPQSHSTQCTRASLHLAVCSVPCGADMGRVAAGEPFDPTAPPTGKGGMSRPDTLSCRGPRDTFAALLVFESKLACQWRCPHHTRVRGRRRAL